MTSRSALFVGSGLVVAVALCGIWWQGRGDPTWRRIRSSGVIRIGYAVEPPYAFLTPDGRVTGESPEVAARVAARLGIRQIEWRQTEFLSLIPELENGRIDLIAAGLFITHERASRVAFSEPTCRVAQALLVPRGNPRALRSYEDVVREPGLKMAVLSGSVEEVMLQQLGLPANRAISVPDALTGRLAVESALADALALSAPTVRWMARHAGLGATEMASPFVEPGRPIAAGPSFVGLAVRRDDFALLAAVNTALAQFVGTDAHRQLVRGLGLTDDEVPAGATTAGVLGR